MTLSKEEKTLLRDVLKRTNNLPPAQGQVTINITAESQVASVEVKVVKR